MKLLPMIFGLVALLGQAAANPKSLGYELEYMYYIYKAEYNSKVDPANRMLATGCGKATKKMCLFDEFVMEVITPGKPLFNYLRTHGSNADLHTDTPGPAAYSDITSVATRRDEVLADKLSTTFPAGGKRIIYSKLVADVTSAMQKAAKAGGVVQADIDGAVNNARGARTIRAQDSYTYVRNHFIATLPANLVTYFDHDDVAKTFGFRKSFDNINTAYSAGTITKAEATTYRNQFRDATHGILTGASRSTTTHWAIVGGLTTFNAKAKAISASLAASKPPDIPGGSACAPESSKAAGSTTKRRRDNLGEYVAAARRSLKKVKRGTHVNFDDSTAMDALAMGGMREGTAVF